jgi:hypothetical protein
MAQVVSFQPLTVSHVRFVVDKSGIRTCFSPSASAFPCHYYSINVPNSFSFTVALTRTKGSNLGNFYKATLFRKSGTTGWKSTFTFFFHDSDSQRSMGALKDNAVVVRIRKKWKVCVI